ncbi:YkvA family protein [Paramaledivibacter caminithermalis]|jgi:uncharacterized membrane protein YkvA (DUF1232 family)|uniref:DUF1232 domain-containing protein n=1 Tax=Paramaledivibacter caminithermalis (strain DSM 15212 / CIP 107654 / DViRD3) TaxID=1121301 RepID=A0A1M6RM72_PARC5|nr:DUF1232 domain-containing protein [Paramaledivibacter caminithermalis]SHK33447.1 Protein of unknown function [Paramaledivibacter caminithermalis DSM 15212]
MLIDEIKYLKGGFHIKRNYYQRYSNFNYFRVIFKFFKRISVLYKYLVDKNVSILKKIMVTSMLIYVFSPLDLIPEVVVGFGLIDDALLAIYVISLISSELDKYISNQEKENIRIDKEKTIENVEYEIKDKDYE